MSHWNTDLIRRYDIPGPRYTSYPPANHFHEEVSEADYWQALELGNQERRRVSLYLHIPFCEHVCYYCACNRIITADHSRASRYLKFMIEELALKGARIDHVRPVTQLHWGGGTPTYLSDAEMTELVYHTARHFHLLEDDRGDYSIEIDPRTVTAKRIGLLRGLGFNRASLGVQDLDPRVQRAVNRVQPYEQVRDVFDWLHEHGYHSINTDLIYGLPWQSASSLARTIEKLEVLRPHRISLYNYAHLPARFKVQRQINELALPSPDEKLRMLAKAGQMLEDAGYVLIGMDHFALPEDEMAVAQRLGALHRNFQGYTVRGDADLIGLGVSSISQLGTFYGQNAKSVELYQDRVATGALPIERGYLLNRDEEIRRDMIMSLLCDMAVNLEHFEASWRVKPSHYFAPEFTVLQGFVRDGLVQLDERALTITPAGRALARAVAMVFDRFQAKAGSRYSRII